MASEEHDTVFDHDLDDDDDSSQSQDDDDLDVIVENDDVLADDDDEEEDLNSVSPSTSSPLTVPIAVPSASIVTVALPNGVNINPPPPSASMDSSTPPDPKRQRFETTLVIHQPEEKRPQQQPPPPPPPQQIDESRRLFQRLWTDEDEIELLQGFLDYTTQRGTNHHDTALFYDQIKSKLQLDFNKNQLVEKLRRLKKKYRNVLAKISSGKEFSFKTLHDQATFEISRKIWSSTGKICGEDGHFDDEDANPNHNHNLPNCVEAEVKIEDPKSTPRSRKRSRPRSASAAAASGVKLEEKRMPNEPPPPPPPSIDINNNLNNSSPNVSGLIEETIKSCLSPLLKELLNNAVAAGSSSSCNGRGGIGGLAMNAMPLTFGGGETMVDDKWRKQQILELEVYSKRLELVQDQIRAQLDELRSMSG